MDFWSTWGDLLGNNERQGQGDDHKEGKGGDADGGSGDGDGSYSDGLADEVEELSQDGDVHDDDGDDNNYDTSTGNEKDGWDFGLAADQRTKRPPSSLHVIHEEPRRRRRRRPQRRLENGDSDSRSDDEANDDDVDDEIAAAISHGEPMESSSSLSESKNGIITTGGDDPLGITSPLHPLSPVMESLGDLQNAAFERRPETSIVHVVEALMELQGLQAYKDCSEASAGSQLSPRSTRDRLRKLIETSRKAHRDFVSQVNPLFAHVTTNKTDQTPGDDDYLEDTGLSIVKQSRYRGCVQGLCRAWQRYFYQPANHFYQCFIFPPADCIMRSWYFDTGVFLVIIVNCVFLAMDRPNYSVSSHMYNRQTYFPAVIKAICRRIIDKHK